LKRLRQDLRQAAHPLSRHPHRTDENDATEQFTFYGGVNNLTDEAPFANRVSYPVSPLGRFFFVGARARF
jgi:outer membrane receptor protein involved in Fe transport